MADTRKDRPAHDPWESRANLSAVKWLGVFLPLLFLGGVDALRRTVFSEHPYIFSGVSGALFTYAVITAAIVVFSHIIFGFIGRLQRRIVDQNRRISALNSIAAAAAEPLALDDLLATGLDHVLEAMKADAGLICLVDAKQEEHSAVSVRGFSDDVARRIQRAKLKDDPVAQEVVRSGRPVIIERVFDDPRVAELARREGIRFGISAPLKSEGEVNGILVVATRRERHFSAADQEFLDGIGGHLGLAIRNAILYEESRLRNRELSALLAVGSAAASSLDLDELLRTSLDTIIEVTSADAGEVWLPEGDRFVIRSHRGANPEAFHEQTSFRVGEGFPGIVGQTGEPVVVHDLPSDPRFLRQSVARAGFHTFYALPMRYRDRLVGVLAVAALSEKSVREPWELRLLEAIGDRVALAIENSHLHQQVQDLAVVQERERIAREMHDGLGQVLGYINTQTLAVKKLMSDNRIQDATEELSSLEEIARDLYADVREGILGLRTSHPSGTAA